MDKVQKTEYTEGIEDYLEEHKVYDYFYELMKDLIVHRPKNPIDFLIEKISKSDCFRSVIIGPPGFSRLGLGRLVAAKIGWKYLNMSEWISKEKDLIKDKPVLHVKAHKGKHEETKTAPKTELHHEFIDLDEVDVKDVRQKVITADPNADINDMQIFNDISAEVNEDNGFISDKIAIEIFKKRWKEFEHNWWILEGFPKTRAQALALGKNQVVPDKIFILKYSDDVVLDHICQSLKERYGDAITASQITETANRILTEYHLHIKGVEELFKNVVHIIDAHGYVKGYKDEENKVSIFVSQISRLILTKRPSPERKQRIIIVGHPGSGRSTQGELIAKRFDLVHICTANLLKNEIRIKSEKGKRIKECFAQNKLVPDEVICSLIETRIRQRDWKTNGWVLDGFPKTIQQITVLKAMKIKPTKVVILEWSKQACVDRIYNRCFDPVTGKTYHLVNNLPEELEVKNRLVPYFQDITKDKIAKRWEVWDDFQVKVEESYHDAVIKFNTEEYSIEQVRDQITEFLQNPLF